MKRSFLLTMLFASFLTAVAADVEKPAKWDLKTCIEYAKKNNIQIQKARIAAQESSWNLRQSKEALLPSVSASSNLSLSNGYNANNASNNVSVGSSYAVNAGMTLFNGLINYNTIRQNALLKESSELSTQKTENDIVVSLTEAYLEILYAHETLETAEQTAETSKAQVALSKNLLNAGSIAKADFSQVQSQYSSDLYAVVTAQNNYDACKLALKQLLELDITDELEVVFPEIQESEVLKPLPGKEDVYRTALNVLPEVQSSERSVQLAELDLKNALGSRYPTLSLNTGLSTGHLSGGNTFFTQLDQRFSQSAGLSLSIPIYSNGSVRTSIQKARLGIQSAQLDRTSTQKTLLKTIESLYQDAVSMQSKFQAANEQLRSAEESYKLTEEQFRLGMKNTVELLTAKNKRIEAEKAVLQAKYGAVLSQKLLNFYQNIPIEL